MALEMLASSKLEAHSPPTDSLARITEATPETKFKMKNSNRAPPTPTRLRGTRTQTRNTSTPNRSFLALVGMPGRAQEKKPQLKDAMEVSLRNLGTTLSSPLMASSLRSQLTRNLRRSKTPAS